MDRIKRAIPAILGTQLLLVGCIGGSPNPPPTAGSMPALLVGDVGPVEGASDHHPGTLVADGCVSLATEGGATFPIVWEIGTTMSTSDTVLLPENVGISIGSEMPAASGRLVEAGSLPDSILGVEQCVASPKDLVLVLDEGVLPHISGQ